MFLDSTFYPIASGPDSAAVAGITESVKTAGSIFPSVGQYPWPGFYINASGLSQVTGLSIAQCSLFFWLALVALFWVVLVTYSSRLTQSRTSYLVPVMYFVGFRSLINLQFAPQTLALVILAILLLITFGSERHGPSTEPVVIILSLSLVLDHPFFWVVFVAGVLLAYSFLRLRNSPGSKFMPGSLSLAIAVLVGLAYNLFYISAFLLDLKAELISPLGIGLTQLFSILGTGTRISSVATAPEYHLIAYTSGYAQILIILAAGSAMVYRLFKGQVRPSEYSVVLAALSFFIIASVFAFAWRAIQIGAILAVGSLAYSLNYKRIRTLATVVVIVGLLSIPFMTARFSWYSSGDYLSVQSTDAVNYLVVHSGVPSSVAYGGFADKSTADYLNGLLRAQWTSPIYIYDSARLGNTCMVPSFKYILVTPLLGQEMESELQCSTTQVVGNIYSWDVQPGGNVVYSSFAGSAVLVSRK